MIGFPIDQVIGSGPERFFVGCSVGPESIIKLERLVLARGTDCLLQDVLDLSVGNFNMATRLRVICSCYLVLHTILLQQPLEHLVYKVCSSVAEDHSRNSKPWEND